MHTSRTAAKVWSLYSPVVGTVKLCPRGCWPSSHAPQIFVHKAVGAAAPSTRTAGTCTSSKPSASRAGAAVMTMISPPSHPCRGVLCYANTCIIVARAFKIPNGSIVLNFYTIILLWLVHKISSIYIEVRATARPTAVRCMFVLNLRGGHDEATSSRMFSSSIRIRDLAAHPAGGP